MIGNNSNQHLHVVILETRKFGRAAYNIRLTLPSGARRLIGAYASKSEAESAIRTAQEIFADGTVPTKRHIAEYSMSKAFATISATTTR